MIKVLGLLIDDRMGFGQHVEKIIDRAKIRKGLLSRVSGFSRCLDTGVMKMAAETLISSLLCYAPAVFGAIAYEQRLKKIDAAVINSMAREVLGAGILARLITLRAAAGVKSMRNLFLLHCAELLDSSLRVTNGAIQDCLAPWISDIYGVKTWVRRRTPFCPERPEPVRRYGGSRTLRQG